MRVFGRQGLQGEWRRALRRATKARGSKRTLHLSTSLIGARGVFEVVSGCSNEMVGTIIRCWAERNRCSETGGDYAKYGANHGRPAYRKMDLGPTGQAPLLWLT